MLKNLSALIFLTFFSYITMSSDAQSDSLRGSEERKQQNSPPHIGNFTLPASQQPGPLLSFGQTVTDKNQAHFFLFVDYLKGNNKHASDVIPSFSYGITDDLSILFTAPIVINSQEGGNLSSGVGDMIMQLEYAFYSNETSSFAEHATIVTNMSFPTGSTKKQPSTGVGAPSFFWGATFNRTYIDWFGFTSYGLNFKTASDKTRLGNEFLYQMGVGRNICTIDSELIIAGLVEMNGQYVGKTKIMGDIDPDSGGNVIYLTPSLWFSTQKASFQFGFGVPVTQRLFGNQNRNDYLVAANFGWNF